MRGVVVEFTAYGPPNYGEDPETDAKVRGFVLVLDPPIASLHVPDDWRAPCVADIYGMHLLPGGVSVDTLRQLAGMRVTFSVAEYFQAITGHHRTRVLIVPDAVRTAEPAPADFALSKAWPGYKQELSGTPIEPSRRTPR